jgi:5-(carboxyamino)imidazole ribonucleotide mutase
MKEILVGIVVDSGLDLSAVQGAKEILEKFAIGYEIEAISAHLTPKKAHQYATFAEKRGLEVIIAFARRAAHLPGVIASLTSLPVIGIPVESRELRGMDSLFSILQMPPGVPVATVAVGRAGAKNAAILAAQILGVKYPEIREKIREYKREIALAVEEKARKLPEK